jgi:hypothetical protein
LAKTGFGEVLESCEKIQLAKRGIGEITESRIHPSLYTKVYHSRFELLYNE